MVVMFLFRCLHFSILSSNLENHRFNVMALCRITFLWPSIKPNNNNKMKILHAHRVYKCTQPIQIESRYMQSMVSILLCNALYIRWNYRIQFFFLQISAAAFEVLYEIFCMKYHDCSCSLFNLNVASTEHHQQQ